MATHCDVSCWRESCGQRSLAHYSPWESQRVGTTECCRGTLPVPDPRPGTRQCHILTETRKGGQVPTFCKFGERRSQGLTSFLSQQTQVCLYPRQALHPALCPVGLLWIPFSSKHVCFCPAVQPSSPGGLTTSASMLQRGLGPW